MHRVEYNSITFSYITEFKKGSITAFGHFYDLFYIPLSFFAEQIILDKPAAEDVVTDVFIKLWEKRGSFNTEENIKAFLYISTKNACRNILKHKSHIKKYEESTKYPIYQEDLVLDKILFTEVYWTLYNAIEKLPNQCQNVLKMSYLEQMKNQEIADKLNISINTVKTQKARALLLLRKKLGNKHLMVGLLLWPYFVQLINK
ncbi:RNA polymerase sigma-70 factor, ECF subfamily [Chitinophaga sp. CF118]|uniref:RNA polymerase sigma-70 factor n=1 Tax=Chitinophaga sp. CF118 TaxID=1884367 RepID=UPI0008E09C2E|nr:RNA polymerase sigma-70 factor [Chitinophaga sp. CF118]SFD01138.1 RNA polymerase sigma-70 factor, ECF subfamily [Chitinophaga sp. CF118]